MNSNHALIMANQRLAALAELERIPTQEELMGEESKKLLLQGIDLVKVKPALRDLINALRVDSALSGEPLRIAIHWSIHGPLKNWMKAEFPKFTVESWPWGNWWEVRTTFFNPETQTLDRTLYRLGIT